MHIPAAKFAAVLGLFGLALWSPLAAAHEEAEAEKADPDSKVVVLTTSTFDAAVKDGPIMVEFYAPWCGHCKKLAPEYEAAAKELDKSMIKLAKVDCTVETEVCTAQGVQGYPTLKVFRESRATDYNQGRTTNDIVSFMKKQLLPALSDVTEKNAEEIKTQDKVVVVGYFDGADSKAYEAFKSVANQFRDEYVFGAAVDVAVAKKEDVKVPAVVLYKQFDEKKNIFPENVPSDLLKVQGTSTKDHLTVELITKFIQVNSIPLIADIGPENYGKFVESGLPLAYIFIEGDEQRTKLAPQVEPVARKYRGKINFVYIDAEQFGGHARNLNLNETWPALAIEDPQKHLKYPFPQDKEITEASVGQFSYDLLNGKLSPSIKSEPIPETNDEPVKVIVGDSYKDIVLDTSKDVLLEFYAPWCGHCKRLAPIYENLAKRLSVIPSIVIAKMDATENDLPPDSDFVIEGFPTIKLFKSGDNTVVDFSGDREEEAFVEFLKENAGISFEVPAPLEASDKVPVDDEEGEMEEEEFEAPEEEEEDEGHEEL